MPETGSDFLNAHPMTHSAAIDSKETGMVSLTYAQLFGCEPFSPASARSSTT
jgi:hypothetical protein